MFTRNARFTERCAGFIFAFGLLAIPTIQSLAAPLDKNSCAKLAQDMENIKALDVDKLMEKGPLWAASHLSPGDLNLVRQYIDLDEQMKFRCSAPGSLVHLKHLDDDDDESGPKPVADAESDADKEAPAASSAPAETGSTQPPKDKPAKAIKKPKSSEQAGSGNAH